MSHLNSKDFKRLHEEWKEKLEGSGFKDAEDSKGRLKTPDRRTIAFTHRDRIRDFFLLLDHFMTHYDTMPKHERIIMQGYSDGKKFKVIAKESRMSVASVVLIIRRYKNLMMTIEKMTRL